MPQPTSPVDLAGTGFVPVAEVGAWRPDPSRLRTLALNDLWPVPAARRRLRNLRKAEA